MGAPSDRETANLQTFDSGDAIFFIRTLIQSPPMKRLWGRLFDLLAGTSLLLCIASAVMWNLSYRRYESPTYSRPNGIFLQLTSWHGDLCFDLYHSWPDDCTAYYTASPTSGGIGPFFGSPGNPATWENYGISFRSGPSGAAVSGGKVLCFLHDATRQELLPQVQYWQPLGPGFELSIPDAYVVGLFGILPLVWCFTRLSRWR
jgi:hypothetical protein